VPGYWPSPDGRDRLGTGPAPGPGNARSSGKAARPAAARCAASSRAELDAHHEPPHLLRGRHPAAVILSGNGGPEVVADLALWALYEAWRALQLLLVLGLGPAAQAFPTTAGHPNAGLDDSGQLEAG
jgi:hypothetical protein